MYTKQIIPSIILLAGAILFGIFFKKNLGWEKSIYKKYFPSILWVLAIASAIFWTLNYPLALTLTFLFVMILFWNKK